MIFPDFYCSVFDFSLSPPAQILHAHRREIENMSADSADRHQLDENLGSTSGILMRKALQRLYGEKTREIIAGLQRNPQLAIPLVLKRLQAKDEEWRAARCAFNDGWREAHERYYLKSLDYQGPTFKQNDFKVSPHFHFEHFVDNVIHDFF